MNVIKSNYQKSGLFCVILFLVSNLTNCFSQEKGEAVPGFKSDSVFVFHSPRPLISVPPSQRFYENGWGFHLTLSNNGFGFGAFYQKSVNKDLNLNASLLISAARNTDEIVNLYSDGYNYIDSIPGKIHRLTLIPITFGLEQNIFTNLLTESFRPFISGGVGTALILASPYTWNDWFKDVGNQKPYLRFSAFIGAGANFSGKSQSIRELSIRYYFIPFGGNGLESILGNPIHDFGGLFITLTIGFRY